MSDAIATAEGESMNPPDPSTKVPLDSKLGRRIMDARKTWRRRDRGQRATWTDSCTIVDKSETQSPSDSPSKEDSQTHNLLSSSTDITVQTQDQASTRSCVASRGNRLSPRPRTSSTWPSDSCVSDDDILLPQASTSDRLYETCEHIMSTKRSRIDLVRQLGTKQTYARKTFRQHCGEENVRSQYEQELKVMQLLRDQKAPHVTSIRGWSACDDDMSLIMEPAAECSLRQYLERPGQGFRQKLSQWVGCLAAAVRFLHSDMVNIRHGDIKPANILIRGSDIFLADFGEAKTMKREEGPVQCTGRFTEFYSAPEVLEQGLCTKSTDIWALGCVFAEIFTILCNRAYHSYHQMLFASREAKKDLPPHRARLCGIQAWVGDLMVSVDQSYRSWQSCLKGAVNTILRMIEPCVAERLDADQVQKRFPHNEPSCGLCDLIPALNIGQKTDDQRAATLTQGSPFERKLHGSTQKLAIRDRAIEGSHPEFSGSPVSIDAGRSQPASRDCHGSAQRGQKRPWSPCASSSNPLEKVENQNKRQQTSRKVVLQLSKDARDQLLQILKEPTLTAVYCVPLKLTPISST